MYIKMYKSRFPVKITMKSYVLLIARKKTIGNNGEYGKYDIREQFKCVIVLFVRKMDMLNNFNYFMNDTNVRMLS